MKIKTGQTYNNKIHPFNYQVMLASILENPILTVIDGLLLHFDFAGNEPMRSKGKYFNELIYTPSVVKLGQHGMVSSSSLIIQGSQPVKISFEECPLSELSGDDRHLTVMGWLKTLKKQDGPGPSEKTGKPTAEWEFYCSIFSQDGRETVVNVITDSNRSGSPFRILLSGTSLRNAELLIDIPETVEKNTSIPSMLSGLTIFNRALSRHEINLIYHHM